MRHTISILTASVLVLTCVLACSASSVDPGISDDGGICFGGAEPDASLADEKVAIFVSPAGSDVQGDGTRAHPFKTITTALAKVEGQRRHLYACGNAYAEDLVTTDAHAGLVFVGGLDCASWKANGSRVVLGSGVANTGRETPIVIAKAESPLTFVGVEARGSAVVQPPPPPNLAGSFFFEWPHAIAAQVAGDVVFCRSRLVADRGLDGKPGDATIDMNMPFFVAGSCVSTCAPGSGKPGDPGHDGAPAPTGATDGGALVGVTPDAYFLPRAGPDGAYGMTGLPCGGPTQTPPTCGGGCGGHATGGHGGGASIAIFALDAKVTLVDSMLVTTGGGAGGRGVAGHVGQSGASSATDGCIGVTGGAGGAGGGSGGGAGGLSIGVAYHGSPPVLDAATSAALALGSGGKGGAGSNASNGGIDGTQTATLALQVGK